MKKILTGLLIISILILLFTACSKENRTSDDITDGSSADAYKILNTEYEITMSLDKLEYKEGDTITVTIQSGNWYIDTAAWIGIIPSVIEHGNETINDENDIDYRYLVNMTEGKMDFIAPVPGNYDIRINNNDNDDSIEIGYISFTVK